jgi:hypothetical protein
MRKNCVLSSVLHFFAAFLQCSPDNADHIFEELKSRIARIKALHPSSPPRPLPVVREKISPTTADAAASTEPDQPIKKPKIQESN